MRGERLAIGTTATLEFPPPLAAGIVNVTDDSFFAGARSGTPERAVADGLALVEAGLRPARRRRGRGPQRPAGGSRRRGGPPGARDRAAGRRGGGARARRHLLARGRRAGRSMPARPRSTTSAAATRRCSSWSPSAGAATCSCTSRGRRASTGAAPHYDDVVGHWASGSPSGSTAPRPWASTPEQIALDPGLDFDLTTDDGIEILRRLGELRELGRPLFVALSRKDFLGAIARRLLGGAARAGRPRTGDAGGDGPRRRRRAPRCCACTTPTALDAMRTAAAIDGCRRRGVRRTKRGPPLLRRLIRDRARRRPAAGLGAAAGGGRARRPARGDQRRARPGRPRMVEARRRALARAGGGARARRDHGALHRTRSRRSRPPRAGDVIVTSGTASGKSLSFNLPVLDAIARDPKSRALYVYPTKALAQDQARKLSELGLPELRHAIYDGDTPKDDRPAIRRRSNLVLTNPDMLNMAVLAHHKGWGDFLANLRLGRRRRGAHLPRRLRLARRQRAAPAAPGGPRLRLRAALHLRLGDDRQPGRARRAAGRAPSSRSSTPTARRGPSAGSRSGTRR